MRQRLWISFVMFFGFVLLFTLILSHWTATSTEGQNVSSSTFTCDTVVQIPQTECNALVALYDNTGGLNSSLSGWLSTTTPCGWPGVVCATVPLTHVTSLLLDDIGLHGTIPPELGDLAYLKELSLNGTPHNNNSPGNQLSGSIPAQLGNLRSLERLNLRQNQLSGNIPPELGNLRNLRILILDHNRLTGPIPPELGNLTKLEELELDANWTTGIHTGLSGDIPREFGNLRSLRNLELGMNQLTGNIPPELGNLTNLEYLELSGNQLSGTLPWELGRLSKLYSLYLSHNQFDGAIPQEFGNLHNLSDLVLDHTNLSGPLPHSLMNLAELSRFSFESTGLCEPSDASFQAWLSGLGDVESTDIICTSSYSVLGRVLTSVGHELGSVIISDGAGHSVATDNTGSYGFINLSTGSYTLTPQKRGYIFTPPSRRISIPPPVTGQDFTATSGAALTISHIEVTQVVGEYPDVPLIAGKPTLVRVYVDCGEGCSAQPGVTGALRVLGPSGELGTRAPINQTVTARHSAGGWRAQRGDISATLNFSILPGWTQYEQVTFQAEVGGQTSERSFPFTEAKTIFLYHAPVIYDRDDCPDIAPYEPNIAEVVRLAKKVFPVSLIVSLPFPSVTFSGQLLGIKYPCSNIKADHDLHYWADTDLHFALKRHLLSNILNSSPTGIPTYIVGWVPPSLFGASSASDFGSGNSVLADVGPPVEDSSFTYHPERIVAHEVAHLLGHYGINLPDVSPYEDDCVSEHGLGGDPGEPEWNERFRNTKIQDFGIDVTTYINDPDSTDVLKNPNDYHDYMSYCPETKHSLANVWTSPWTYDHIFNDKLWADASRAHVMSKTSTSQSYLLSSGLVFTDDTVLLDPMWIIIPTTAVELPSMGSEYCLEEQDRNGSMISQYCFDLDFYLPSDVGGPTDVDGFLALLPHEGNAAQVVLRKGNVILATQSVSPNVPTVTVLSPNGGEVFTGDSEIQVSWSGADGDGDLLTYSVLYSTNGTEWLPVSSQITRTTTTINADELGGGTTARVKVLVSDGINTSSDESDEFFTVGTKAPVVSILTPEQPITVTVGSLVWMEAYAYDLEDQLLAGDRIGWSSDRDGTLGSGVQVLTALSEGVHTITASVTDSDNNTVADTVEIMVTDTATPVPNVEIYLPALTK